MDDAYMEGFREANKQWGKTRDRNHMRKVLSDLSGEYERGFGYAMCQLGIFLKV